MTPPVQVAPVQPPQAPVRPAPRVAPVVIEEQVAPEPAAPPQQVIIRRRPPPPAAPPPIVVYQPVPAGPPTQVIVVTPGYGGYGYGGYGGYARQAPPPPRMMAQHQEPRWHPEFGLNLRVEGVALGHTKDAAFSAGLGGVGMSLRYRPVPAFAFDLGVDVLAGTDYNGFQRTEIPISLGGMIFLNPKSRVQLFIEGGAHFSRAQVRSDIPSPLLHEVEGGSQFGSTYTYFGGQGGGGFEFRLSRRVALDLDCVGFVRKRVDDGKQPEFVDAATGRTTNTSGGALFRGGINFWW